MLPTTHKVKNGSLSNTGMGPGEVTASSSLWVLNIRLDEVLKVALLSAGPRRHDPEVPSHLCHFMILNAF